jgi:glycosyltransferase involved in cell wall biosynthesis
VGSGGVEQRRLLLAKGLDRTEFSQALICTQAMGGLPERFAQAGCALHEIGVFRHIGDKERYTRALRIIEDYRPHIIHGAVFEGVAVAAVAGRLGGVPIIIGEETSDPVNRRWRGHLLYRSLAALTHRMVAISPAVRDYLVRRIAIAERKVALINNGVAEPAPVDGAVVARLRASLGITTDDIVIGSVGRLQDDHKRFSDLIRALACVRQSCPAAKLLIVGGGQDEAMLRSLAAKLGVGDHVLLAGYQPDPLPYYELMHLFALASAYEGLPLVVVEAMFKGLPVVATRVAGIPWVVREGETGFLVEPFAPEALAMRLIQLCSDQGLMRRLGGKGRLRAKSEFNADRYVRDVAALYRTLAEERLGQ